MRAVHQLLPNLGYGDAISSFALLLRDLARSRGCRSDIYVRYMEPAVRRECIEYHHYSQRANPDDFILYHYSVGSEITEYFLRLPNRKAIIYHNITPAEYFLPYNLTLYNVLRQGRQDMVRLSAVPALYYSQYSANELRHVGFTKLHAVPFLWDSNRFDRKPDSKVLRAYGDGWWNVLFVGRVAPNKRHEDLIKIFHLYKRHLNPRARLLLVGLYQGLEVYHAALQEIISALGVDNVIFTGKVRLRELVAYYRVGSVFLNVSEHEGFSVPLLEAMYCDLPIVAYDAAAVPFTLDGAGVLVREKNYAELAELIELIRTDGALRTRILETQRARLRDLLSPANKELFWKVLQEISA